MHVLVLNPTLRLEWIDVAWEEDWIARAKEIIRAEVSAYTVR